MPFNFLLSLIAEIRLKSSNKDQNESWGRNSPSAIDELQKLMRVNMVMFDISCLVFAVCTVAIESEIFAGVLLNNYFR